jgi:hypothetical protein
MPSLPDFGGVSGALMNIAIGMAGLWIINQVIGFGRQITGGVGGIIGLFWDWAYWSTLFTFGAMGYLSLPSPVTTGISQLGGLKRLPVTPPGQ